jgi:predicted transcriptional regulator
MLDELAGVDAISSSFTTVKHPRDYAGSSSIASQYGSNSMADADQSNLTLLTVDLLSAYVANNTIQHGDLAELIKSTHAALKTIDSPELPAPVEPEHKPAVTVRKSLASRSHIISMIDGKPYQTLKRHLSRHGLTPQDYRARYGLPRDYPMVSAAYSESRRAIAARLGLGRKVTGGQAPAADKPAAPAKAAAFKPAASKRKAAKAAPKADVAAVPAAAAAAPTKQASKPRAPRKAKAGPASAVEVPAAATPTRKRATKAAPSA